MNASGHAQRLGIVWCNIISPHTYTAVLKNYYNKFIQKVYSSHERFSWIPRAAGSPLAFKCHSRALISMVDNN